MEGKQHKAYLYISKEITPMIKFKNVFLLIFLASFLYYCKKDPLVSSGGSSGGGGGPVNNSFCETALKNNSIPMVDAKYKMDPIHG